MQQLTALFYLGSLALLTVQSSMGLTQPTWTCHTLLSPLRLVQQGTLSVWYWGSDWTPQLCTTTLCLQLVVMSLWQCKGPSQHRSTVCAMYIYAWCVLIHNGCVVVVQKAQRQLVDFYMQCSTRTQLIHYKHSFSFSRATESIHMKYKLICQDYSKFSS